MHTPLGAAITAASVAAYCLSFTVGMFFERVLTCLEKQTRKVRSL